jgi:hypothetical protein
MGASAHAVIARNGVTKQSGLRFRRLRGRRVHRAALSVENLACGSEDWIASLRSQ